MAKMLKDLFFLRSTYFFGQFLLIGVTYSHQILKKRCNAEFTLIYYTMMMMMMMMPTVITGRGKWRVKKLRERKLGRKRDKKSIKAFGMT